MYCRRKRFICERACFTIFVSLLKNNHIRKWTPKRGKPQLPLFYMVVVPSGMSTATPRLQESLASLNRTSKSLQLISKINFTPIVLSKAKRTRKLFLSFIHDTRSTQHTYSTRRSIECISNKAVDGKVILSADFT